MCKVNAKGILRHGFFGTYVATVALGFDDAAAAADALKALGAPWQTGKKNPAILVCNVSGEELKAIKAQLAKLGRQIEPCGRASCGDQCKGEEIDGVPHSIDVGPAFRVSIPVVPAEQAKLFG